jgi:hypothetical protein
VERAPDLGLYPIVTLQYYSSTTLYQLVSNHIR